LDRCIVASSALRTELPREAGMVDETADELIQNCITATREGADFPTVWQTLLRGHSLVAGPAIQSIESGRVSLKIPLIDNQRLVFDSTSKEFVLRRR